MWLSQCAGAAWAGIAAAQEHARHAVTSATPPPFEALQPDAAAEIEALAACVIPSGDGPGAREAGVIYFIDRALSTFDAGKLEAYRAGLAATQQKRLEMFPDSRSIAGLPLDRQIELVRAIENASFFELLRTHTVYGFLGDPRYGGNRGRVGWQLIGFEDRMSFAPPFGYYDDPAHREDQ